MEDSIVINTGSVKQNQEEEKHIVLKQGAEGRIYLGDIFGMQCIVKERFKKKYRVAELDEKLTRQRILQVKIEV